MRIRRFKKSVCIVLGLLVATYGVALLFGLEALSFGKLTAAARDTSTGVLVLLFGATLFLFGFFIDPAGRG
jgi:hypothetical protein